VEYHSIYVYNIYTASPLISVLLQSSVGYKPSLHERNPGFDSRRLMSITIRSPPPSPILFSAYLVIPVSRPALVTAGYKANFVETNAVIDRPCFPPP
jgi:hypothetical protein